MAPKKYFECPLCDEFRPPSWKLHPCPSCGERRPVCKMCISSICTLAQQGTRLNYKCPYCRRRARVPLRESNRVFNSVLCMRRLLCRIA